MSDNRKKMGFDDFKKLVVKILVKKPLQAKNLKLELEKEGVAYSSDRLNDLLNQMMYSGDIKRTIQDGNKYPVYEVRGTSKVRAEFNGLVFRAFFEDSMFKNYNMLMKEFEYSKHNKNNTDALLQFLGFFVLGSIIASHQYGKKLRPDWIRPVLDLERGNRFSYFIDQLMTEDTLVEMIHLLERNYKENMSVLEEATRGSMDIKKMTVEDKKSGKGMFRFVVDKMKKN